MAISLDRFVSDLLSGPANDQSDYIAQRMLPTWKGAPQVGQFVRRSGLAGLVTNATGTYGLTAASAGAVPLPPVAETAVAYNTKAYMYKRDVFLDNNALDEKAMDDLMIATEEVVQETLYEMDIRLELLIRTATWATGSGAVANGAEWNDAGDPMGQLIAASQKIPGGVTDILMGQSAWASFRTNDAVKATLADNQFRAVTESNFLDTFALVLDGRPSRLWVPKALRADGTPIFDDDVFLARLSSGGVSGRRGPTVNATALARFESGPIYASAKHEEDSGYRGADVVRGGVEEVVVQVSPELGYLLTSVNG